MKTLPVAINEEEFTELIKYTKKDHHKLAFLLGFGSGLRVSEVVNLHPREVILKEKKIFVRQGKGRKDRVVPVPKGFKTKHLSLLPMKCGVRALQYAFRQSAKLSGLLDKKPTSHFHSLRHGFASHAIQRGIPIHDLRTLMGHTNISTTNVYLEMNPTQALKNYEELF
ncbi:hypothetical protein LCGC14_0730000 [marine sediment metagenome]|uniref:Tyr recombinase domain-containing protein n=1 Tax=marine sediment metagenome TaxID=412755 RepID=A0A0F9QE51_9ZZZZ